MTRIQKPLAQGLYEAWSAAQSYCDDDGQPLADWRDLSRRQQEAWQDAADALRDAMEEARR